MKICVNSGHVKVVLKLRFINNANLKSQLTIKSTSDTFEHNLKSITISMKNGESL